MADVTRHLAVTGAASGLGAALAARLADDGAVVIGVDRHPCDVPVPIVADLGTAAGRAEAVAGVLDASGGRLDGLVSAAGLSPLHDDAAAVVSVNLFGALAVLDGLLGALTAGVAPAAVAISSLGAVDGTHDPALVEVLLDALATGDEAGARAAAADGTPYRPAITYASAKRVLALAVRARAGTWGAAGVRLNTVAPGRMETPMLDDLRTDPVIAAGIEAYPTGVQATGSAAEVAGAVRFLLGPDAAFVHGQVLFVDGGSDALLRPDQI